MKKIYDKVLLLLGFVVLCLGVGFVLTKGGIPTPVTPSSPTPVLTGKAYDAIPTPPVPDTQPEWQEPTEQDTGWLYYVFTPPIMFLQGNEIVDIPPSPESLPGFGLVLVGLKQEQGRIQYTGRSGNGDDTVYGFMDTVTGHIDNLKIGETSADLQMKLLSYTAANQTIEDLSLKTDQVTIQDLKDNAEVTLNWRETAFIPGQQYLLLETTDTTPVRKWRVTKAGDTLTLEGKDTGSPDVSKVDYTVKDVNFNFDNPTVTVVKQFPWKGGKPKIQTSVLAASEPSEAPSTPAAK